MSGFPSIDDLLKKNTAGSAIPIKSLAGNKRKSSGEEIAPVLQVASAETEESFSKKFKNINVKEKEREAMRFAQSIGYPHIDLSQFPVVQEALRQVEIEMAKKIGAICFYITSEEIKIGALDPRQEEVSSLAKEIGEKNHASVSVYVISENSLDHVIRLYASLPEIKPITKDISITAEDLEKLSGEITDFDSMQEALNRQSATDILVLLLGVAFKFDASDLHVEAEAEGVVVRLRLDGILHDAAILPSEDYKKLVNRIKLVSSLKLNIVSKPQDGRFTIKLPEGEVDVRVSTVPTIYGESIVMRLLHQSLSGLDLENLGLHGSAYSRLMREIERPSGMIITTGPTGSGKTTTMYAILKLLNKPGVKIITLEDPVEYKMEGVNQSQIEQDKGYTYEKGLKSILRQDPDIIMVGEIRELETAEIAIQAALTGHLVLSTIHTNDAAGAVLRFLSVGVKTFLLANSLNCVMGQRLVRRICTNCKVEAEVDSHILERVGEVISSMSEEKKREVEKKELKFYKGRGCDECGGIGYKGRVGIYEVLPMTAEIKALISGGVVSEQEIKKVAITQGMITMAQDGVLKALEGITSLEEVFRVTDV